MMKRFISLALLLGLLTGCSGLLPDMVGKAPALYEVRPLEQVTSTAPASDRQLLIDIPVASAGIDTPRMALMQADGTLAYYKDVSWTDRAPVMFQTLLVNSFGRSNKLPAVGRDNVGLRADYLLKTDLSHFEADYTAGTPPVVKVTLTARLIIMPRRVIVGGKEFAGMVTAKSDDIADVAKAYQDATDEAVLQLIDWTLVQLNEVKVHSRRWY